MKKENLIKKLSSLNINLNNDSFNLNNDSFKVSSPRGLKNIDVRFQDGKVLFYSYNNYDSPIIFYSLNKVLKFFSIMTPQELKKKIWVIWMIQIM